MSEEAVETTQADAAPSATETATEATQATETAKPNGHDAKPSGYDPVDASTASPEQVKERIDYLYRQVKTSDREKREMTNLLRDQSRIINELSEGQRAVVTHLNERGFADNEEQLKGQMRAAWDKGDNRAYIDAQTNLNKLYAQQEVAKAQRPQQTQQPQQQPSAAEIAARAAHTGELSDQEYRTTSAWQDERDDSGAALRPWAFAGDPNYQAALFEARSVFANPRFANMSHEQKLQEVDRRMGTQKRTASQAVIGGGLTKPAKNSKLTLSSDQERIALRTKYAGKGKSDAEHIDAYRKQVEKYDASKRRAK